MMLEQAVVPDRLQYKGTSTSSRTKKRTNLTTGLHGQSKRKRRRRKRRRQRKD